MGFLKTLFALGEQFLLLVSGRVDLVCKSCPGLMDFCASVVKYLMVLLDCQEETVNPSFLICLREGEVSVSGTDWCFFTLWSFEDPAKKWQCGNQEVDSYQSLNLRAHWSWMSRPPKLRNKFLLFKATQSIFLLQAPEWTKTITLTELSLSHLRKSWQRLVLRYRKSSKECMWVFNMAYKSAALRPCYRR